MSSRSHGKRIYCSGPLFCPEERAGMSRLAGVLEGAGYLTFLPQRDGLETAVMAAMDLLGAGATALPPVSRLVSRAIFALDVYQLLERCDALVLNMNGRVPDEGAVAETAMAFAAGKPVVLYKDDARSIFQGQDNSMILGLSPRFATVSSHDEVVTALGQELREAARQGPSPYAGRARPPHVAQSVAFGARVWKLLEGLRAHRPTAEQDDTLLVELERLADDERPTK
jgi:nucleoside 2-deoxyribosyltransferase